MDNLQKRTGIPALRRIGDVEPLNDAEFARTNNSMIDFMIRIGLAKEEDRETILNQMKKKG